MLTNFKTLNNSNKRPEAIERKFESTRSDYLKELDQLRRKYAHKFIQLSKEYDSACLLQR